MLEVFRPGESIIWDCLWQATLLLGVGLGASAGLARRPARVHRFLVLAILATLVTPVLAMAARHGGLGLLTPTAESPSMHSSTGASPTSVAVESPLVDHVTIPSQALAQVTRIADAREVVTPHKAAHSDHPGGNQARLAYAGWRTLASGGWLILVGLAVVRLGTSLFLGLRLVCRARPLKDDILNAAADAAGVRLGVIGSPELRVSSRMRCPVIWCWGRRPVIVLPEDAAAATSIAWVGVFCHELAHWLRRDHWSSLLGEALVCAVPWHPLTWWARHRLGQLAELACDDWVLATGLPATDYAESLLRLVPERRGALALTAVSSRRGLFGRVRHILDRRRSSPVIGTRWACSSAAAMVLAASAIALAQTRPVVKDQNSKVEEAPKPTRIPEPLPPSSKETTKRRLVGGTVLGPDGKPIANAMVFWISHLKEPLNRLAIPEETKAQPSIHADVLGETATDATGRFSLAADFDPDRYYHQDGSNIVLLVKAPGMGLLAYLVKAATTEVTMRLAPEVVIRGRLLTPSGMPASSVRVTLHDFINDEMTEGMAVGMTPTDDLIPRYWPKPRTTDADGWFTFVAMPHGSYVHLDFWHADYAADEVTVDTATADGIAKVVRPYLKAFEIAPVPPTFTHPLEPARQVQGRVTDKQTARPLNGMFVELSAMRRPGVTPFFSRTDADGRYRVSGHQAESYRTTVFPPAGSGYLASTNLQPKWPGGTNVLEKDFALVKGRIIRGRVIDAETRRPIAGAAVGYKPRRDNPNNRPEYDLRNTVLTDAEGRFAITTVPGQGVVAVQTPDETYMRVPRGPLISPQGVASIDVPKDGETEPVEIAVRKGAFLKATVTGPNGEVVPEIAASCEGFAPMVLIYAWEPSGKGIFRLPGADPAKVYRVFFIQADRQLGAVVDLKPDVDSKQPVEVKLQPTARVHGKVVNVNGSPAEGVQVQPMIAMGRPKDGEMTRSEMLRDTDIYVNLMGQKAMLPYFTKILQPRPKGEFVIDTLVPGARFVITAGAGRREAQVFVPPLKPGEDRDLGTITITERRP
jgi:beta-lactamase regulating signal transducer with metallopeptidase domain